MSVSEPAPVLVDVGSLATWSGPGRTPAEAAEAAEAAAADAGDAAILPLSLGPHHPSGHGRFQLLVTLVEDRIATAEPMIGQLHRGAEKLFENRDYRQLMMLANRHDWLAGFGAELGMALLIEERLGIEVPPRATWLRTLLAELERVHSHLVFLAEFPLAGQSLSERRPDLELPRLREALLQLWDEACGARIHPMYARIGGLNEDVPRGWSGHVQAVLDQIGARLPALIDLLKTDDDLCGQTVGVGVLRPEAAASYGVTGPAARAAGLDLDLRRDAAYLGYPELFSANGPGRVCTATGGDAHDRLTVLADQVRVSLDLVEACLVRLSALPPGPVNVRLPSVVRVPEGDSYAATENPNGCNGYYLVSRADQVPWRVKLRTASFNNVAALSAVLPGTRLADLPAVLATFLIVLGDVDK